MLGKILFLCGVLAIANAQKTPVYVYYESLCPDSQAFITKQLYPSMKILKDHIDLHLIPFGKSTYQTRGSDTTFECHHGPNECYGNKIQACAINHIQVDSFQQENTRESLIVEYINCLMTGVFPDQQYAAFARRCAKDVQVKGFESIEACANSTDGSKYLEQMGRNHPEAPRSFEECSDHHGSRVFRSRYSKDGIDRLLRNRLPEPPETPARSLPCILVSYLGVRKHCYWNRGALCRHLPHVVIVRPFSLYLNGNKNKVLESQATTPFTLILSL